MNLLSDLVPVIYANADRIYIRTLFQKRTIDTLLPIPKRINSGKTNSGKNLIICEPGIFFPSCPGLGELDNIVCGFYGKWLEFISKRTLNKPLVLYVWNPSCYAIANHINADLIVYHPHDFFQEYENDQDKKESIWQTEHALIRKSDIIITCNIPIAEHFMKFHSNVFVVPSGFAESSFSRIKKDYSQPYDIKSIPRPRIGYVGHVNRKVDFSILLELATQKKDWSFVIVGPLHPGNWQKETEFVRFYQLDNTYFLGGKHFTLAPLYLKALDVGLMPYETRDTWAQYCSSPLKLIEYWAVGIPVVSVPLPHLNEIPGALSIPVSMKDWANVIDREIKENSIEKIKKRIELSLDNTWKKRVDEIHQIISKAVTRL